MTTEEIIALGWFHSEFHFKANNTVILYYIIFCNDELFFVKHNSYKRKPLKNDLFLCILRHIFFYVFGRNDRPNYYYIDSV